VAVEQAVVRWVKDDRFGVSFLKLQPTVQARRNQVFQLPDASQQPEVQGKPTSAFARHEHARKEG